MMEELKKQIDGIYNRLGVLKSNVDLVWYQLTQGKITEEVAKNEVLRIMQIYSKNAMGETVVYETIAVHSPSCQCQQCRHIHHDAQSV